MNISCFRIVRRVRAEQCFDGEGARLFGGRWNSKGKRVVYTSESMSLAILETLVHLESHEALGRLYCVRTASSPLSLCEHLRPSLLPDGWNNDIPINATRRIGDDWLTASRSAALAVPSVFSPQEKNYLRNPEHSDFRRIELGPVMDFTFSRRFLKPTKPV